MYNIVMVLILTSGIVFLVAGLLKDSDKKWQQKHCPHEEYAIAPVSFGPPWSRKLESHCTGCGSNMVFWGES